MMTREAAEAILAGERPRDVRVADDYLTERTWWRRRASRLRETDDVDEVGNTPRVKAWEFALLGATDQ